MKPEYRNLRKERLYLALLLKTLLSLRRLYLTALAGCLRGSYTTYLQLPEPLVIITKRSVETFWKRLAAGSSRCFRVRRMGVVNAEMKLPSSHRPKNPRTRPTHFHYASCHLQRAPIRRVMPWRVGRVAQWNKSGRCLYNQHSCASRDGGASFRHPQNGSCGDGT